MEVSCTAHNTDPPLTASRSRVNGKAQVLQDRDSLLFVPQTSNILINLRKIAASANVWTIQCHRKILSKQHLVVQFVKELILAIPILMKILAVLNLTKNSITGIIVKTVLFYLILTFFGHVNLYNAFEKTILSPRLGPEEPTQSLI